MPCSYRSGGKHFKAYISHLTKYQVSPSFQGLKIAANTLVFISFVFCSTYIITLYFIMSQQTVTEDCNISLELLSKQVVAPGPLLDAEWKCRKCGDIASNHKSQPGNTQFIYLINILFSDAPYCFKIVSILSSHFSIALLL
jgi:hypothetical protein